MTEAAPLGDGRAPFPGGKGAEIPAEEAQLNVTRIPARMMLTLSDMPSSLITR